MDEFLKNTTNKVLLAIGITVVLFVITMIVTYWVKGGVPDTLIQYFLGAGGFECLYMAGIKVAKVLKGEEPDDN